MNLTCPKCRFAHGKYPDCILGLDFINLGFVKNMCSIVVPDVLIKTGNPAARMALKLFSCMFSAIIYTSRAPIV